MNLPHPLNRPHQLETAKRILESKAQYVIVNAPTGSGKTAYAAYAASQGLRTLGVVRTKSLQAQYEQGYNFYSITGKGDYECLAFGQKNQQGFSDTFNVVDIDLTADLCEVPDTYYKKCKANCPYPLERWGFVNSQAGIINYAKFLLDRKLVDDFGADIFFLDEAHELPGDNSIVIDFSGNVFNWNNKKLRKYIEPVIIELDESLPYPIAQNRTVQQGIEWLNQLSLNLRNDKPKHPSKGGDRYLYKWHERMLEKVEVILACINIEPRVWFIRGDRYKLTIKPLTSQFHFRRLFEKCGKIVLMSATIQKPDIDALGIEDYEFIKVPSVIPAPMRPVYDLGGPAYTAKMTYQEKGEHAAIISKVFNQHQDWNGIIHTTSEKMAIELADMLSVDNPIWIPAKGDSTVKSYEDWQRFNSRYDNAICISWQFFAGADMGNVAINISARMPYPFFGDEFEKERFNYHPGQARVRVANTLEQQQGRNRRGFSEHYGLGAKKFNAICDGKWVKLKSAMQREFLQSIV